MDKKQSWYNVLFVICVVLLINSIPFALFIKDQLLLNILEIIKRVAALVTFIILSKKEKLDKPKVNKLNKKTFLFIPFILAFVSNFIVVLVNKEIIYSEINYFNIITGFINMLLVAFIEELLFRHLLLNEFINLNVSEEFYKLGKQDAASGKKLSDNELFALAASKFAGDPELNELTTKLLCGCYRDGWNDGGGT